MSARIAVLSASLVFVIPAASSADPPGWSVGARPGPVTRYEWNPSPYRGAWGAGGSYPRGQSSGARFGGGWVAPFPVYVNPPVYAPYGYGYVDPWTGALWPPSYTNYGYSPINPFVIPGGTLNGAIPQPPVDPVFELEQAHARLRNRGPLPPEDRLPLLKPSTPEAQQRSLRFLAVGDQQLRAGRYSNAVTEYRRAIAAAEDLSAGYFRLGYAFIGLRRYSDAVAQFKYGLILDPSWPDHGESLTQVYGDDNHFERRGAINRVAEWVRGDVRDPDRIFLLAALLHFEGDAKNSGDLLESAVRVAGEEPHLMAFLNAGLPAEGDGEPADELPADQSPPSNPVPEPPAPGVTRAARPVPPPREAPATNPAPPAVRPSVQPAGGVVEQAVPQRKPNGNGSGNAPATETPAREATPPQNPPSLQAPPLPTSNPPAGEGAATPDVPPSTTGSRELTVPELPSLSGPVSAP
ncbi:MAG: hypothetical protein KF774_12230 [Planctomyces sp.]|nr:hypothetical protein [Planctomyces sp.]